MVNSPFNTRNAAKTWGIRKLFPIIVLSFLLMGVLCVHRVSASSSENKTTKRVLAIFMFKQGLPWARQIEESMRTALSENAAMPIELDVEHADRSRYPEEAFLRNLVDLYRYKYGKRRIDLVVAVGDESTQMFLEYGEELFGDIPVVLVTSDIMTLPKEFLESNITNIRWGLDFDTTIRIIQDALPHTKHLFVISGTSGTDRALKNLAAKVLRNYDGRFNIEYLSGLGIEPLLEKVARLPKDSAIFYLTLFRDANGKNFIPRDILSNIANKANAPVFGIVDTYLGHGIVGGNLLSAERQGKRYADIAANILSGQTTDDADFIAQASAPMFDWRQLKRWKIKESRLPKGSIIHHKELSVWEQFKWYIIGGIFLLLTQGIFIVYLVYQRKKIRHREQRLRESDNRFRAFMKNSTEVVWCVEFEQPIAVDLPEDEQFELVYKYGFMAEANDAYARMMGLEHGEELVGTRIETFCPRSVPKNVETIKTWIRGRYNISNAESVETYKDGVTRNILNNSTGIIEDGRVKRVWGTATDITDLKQIEMALPQSKDFSKAILNSMEEHISVLDRKGTILTVNSNWNRFGRDNGADEADRGRRQLF